LLESMILLLFLIWLARNFKKRRDFSFGGYGYLILIFLVAATIAVFVSPDRIAAQGIWKAYFIEPILFFIVFVNSMKNREHWSLIVGALGSSALLVAIPAIIQKFTGFGIANPFWAAEETRRVVSWYGFPNAVGLYLAPIVVLFLGMFFWQGRRDKSRFYQGLVIVAAIAAIVFARSEGAAIGILAAVVFLGFFFPNKKLRRTSTCILMALVILVSLITPFRSYVFEKATMSDLSGQIRVQQWKETWSMLTDGRIISGAGLAGYQTVIAPYHAEGIWIKDKGDSKWLDKVLYDEEYKKAHWQPTEIYMYPHNFFLNFWSETGLLGLLAIIALMIKFVANYWRVEEKENKKVYLVLIAVLVAIFVHGLVDAQYFKNDLSVLWWLVFAAGAVVMRDREKIKIS